MKTNKILNYSNLYFLWKKAIRQTRQVRGVISGQCSTWETIRDFTQNLTNPTNFRDYTNFLFYNSKKPLVRF